MKTSLGVVATAMALVAAQSSAQDASSWVTTSVNSLAQAEGPWGTQTLLPSGKVLFVGGGAGADALDAQVYDPAVDAWSYTGLLGTEQYGLGFQTATLLPSGQVLVAGGVREIAPYWDGFKFALASAELYDPRTDSWTPTGSMTDRRHHHVAVALANGTVLVAGGRNDDGPAGANGGPIGEPVATAEVYDPATGTWASVGALPTMPYAESGAVLLPSGKALVVSVTAEALTEDAQLYDPVAGTWSLTGSLPISGFALTLLDSGQVLALDGQGHAELYNPETGSWNPKGSPSGGGQAALLKSGKVLVAGDGTVGSAELYDPSTGAWTPTRPLPTRQYGYSTTLLQSGKVLIANGIPEADALPSNAVYTEPPPSLLVADAGTAPVISPLTTPSSMSGGGCDSTDGSRCAVLMLVLLPLLKTRRTARPGV
jgi:hypothetical protein